jgi:hypothetical protein
MLSLGIAGLLAVAVIRIAVQHPAGALGVTQLPLSVALVLALALLLEAAGAGYGPAAGDNASGAAIALVSALSAAPPRNLAVELVLQGAGEGQEIGIRRYLRAHKGSVRRENAIVLGIAACGAGQPCWWRSDGRMIPAPYTRRLRDLAGEAAPDGVHPHRGRGGTPALPARIRGLPAIAIGNLDRSGLAPRSHQPADTPANLDRAALGRAVEFGLLLIDAIDAALEPDSATHSDDAPEEAITPA